MKPSLSFPEAVRLGFSRMFDFQGRSRRSEFWWFSLALFVIYIVIALIVIFAVKTFDTAISENKEMAAVIFTCVFGILYWLPALAISVRRLHDIGKSGMWLFLYVIPYANFALLVMFCLDSERAENQYGPSPKYSDEDDGSNPNSSDDMHYFNDYNQTGVQF